MNYDQQGAGEPLITHFAYRMQANIRGAELIVLEGCAHAPIYEKVDEFNHQTLAFLRRHSG